MSPATPRGGVAAPIVIVDARQRSELAAWRSPEEAGYRDVYATEARTPGEAAAKVRPLAAGRRLRTYLATGTYKDELADARRVA